MSPKTNYARSLQGATAESDTAVGDMTIAEAVEKAKEQVRLVFSGNNLKGRNIFVFHLLLTKTRCLRPARVDFSPCSKNSRYAFDVQFILQLKRLAAEVDGIGMYFCVVCYALRKKGMLFTKIKIGAYRGAYTPQLTWRICDIIK